MQLHQPFVNRNIRIWYSIHNLFTRARLANLFCFHFLFCSQLALENYVPNRNRSHFLRRSQTGSNYKHRFSLFATNPTKPKYSSPLNGFQIMALLGSILSRFSRMKPPAPFFYWNDLRYPLVWIALAYAEKTRKFLFPKTFSTLKFFKPQNVFHP